MSEFKFACPACGQHIKCAAEQSGTEMACPTCFRKIVVPQSPRDPNSKFILTASEVQSRPTALTNGSIPAPRVNPVKRSLTLTVAGFGLLLVAIAAGLVVFRERLFHRPPPIPMETLKSRTNQPAPATQPADWTLNPAEAQIPESAVTGRVHGADFKLERATITGGLLNLRQGPRWPPDLGVSVYLFANQAEELTGKSVVVTPNHEHPPRVVLRWKDENDQPVNHTLRGGYLLKIQFGHPADGHLPGKIYLATAEDASSQIAGTFKAEIRRPKPKSP